MKKLSDQELWRLFQQGDNNALGVIYARYQLTLFAQLYKIVLYKVGIASGRSKEMVKDAIQDVFKNILENPSFRKKEVKKLKAFILQCAWHRYQYINRCADRKTPVMRNEMSPSTEEFYEVELTVHLLLDKSVYIKAIEGVKNKTYQQIIYWSVFEDKTNEEISEIFEQTKIWVADKKYRALKEYRKVLVNKSLIRT